VLQVDASGGDRSINYPLSYSIVKDQPPGLVMDEENPGWVVAPTGLARNTYTFTVEVRDNWAPKQSVQAEFIIAAV
jgi:hypothetical protein